MKHILNITTIFMLFCFMWKTRCATNQKQDQNRVQYDFMQDPNLFEGDIDLTPVQKSRVRKNQFLVRNDHIKNRLPIIRYVIDSRLDKYPEALKAIKEAHDVFYNYTCMMVLKKRWKDTAYIHYKLDYFSCSSQFGTVPGRGETVIKITPKCFFKQTIQHLFMHAIGFLHEHNRPDRDKYIKIVDKNIDPTLRRKYFKKENAANVTMHAQYDYMSIMHPPWDWFSFGSSGQPSAYSPKNQGGKNRFSISPYQQQVTIETLDSDYKYEIGQRKGLSYWDQIKLNEYMRCNKNINGEFIYDKGKIPSIAPRYYKPDANCVDLSNYCTEWHLRYDYCNSSESDWKSRMNQYCRRTCGKCTKATFSSLSQMMRIHANKQRRKKLVQDGKR